MTSKKFQEETQLGWGDAFATGCSFQEVPSGYLFEGICPRCDDPMTYLVPTKITLSAGAATQRVTHMMCTCRGTHENRPADDEGCGAYWNLRITT